MSLEERELYPVKDGQMGKLDTPGNFGRVFKVALFHGGHILHFIGWSCILSFV